jgi:hypothetical protein
VGHDGFTGRDLARQQGSHLVRRRQLEYCSDHDISGAQPRQGDLLAMGELVPVPALCCPGACGLATVSASRPTQNPNSSVRTTDAVAATTATSATAGPDMDARVAAQQVNDISDLQQHRICSAGAGRRVRSGLV